ncbi:hypothetical protein [Pedobacter aquatilis]|uniref:hypothetical protein n=1 Tax=Pedobacter aquatilis TaxID=351343 RepID=UPI00292F79BA|nr:hypothetical protein [Pedobacter aquatilis]
MDRHAIIPSQQVGQQTDAEEKKVFPDSEAAKKYYGQARLRFVNINEWHKISLVEASRFTLFDSTGKAKKGAVALGDYMRIDIPGPGSDDGHGFDWVHIEHLEEEEDESSDEEILFFAARPSAPAGEMGIVAHFFTSQASSTFILHRKANIVFAAVHGRNEVPNLVAGSLLDKTRNLLINAGSLAGASFTQWHILLKGILD